MAASLIISLTTHGRCIPICAFVDLFTSPAVGLLHWLFRYGIHGRHLYFFADLRLLESVPSCYRTAYPIILVTRSLKNGTAGARFVNYFNFVPASTRGAWLMGWPQV